jgi:hypothetical protein
MAIGSGVHLVARVLKPLQRGRTLILGGRVDCEIDVRPKTKTGVPGEFVDGLQVTQIGGARLLCGR